MDTIKAVSVSKCLVPDCPRDVYSRGVCRNHHVQIKSYVRKGTFTDKELVEKGKLLPKRVAVGRRILEWLSK